MEMHTLVALKSAADCANMPLDRMATIISCFLMEVSKHSGLVDHAVLWSLADELNEAS